MNSFSTLAAIAALSAALPLTALADASKKPLLGAETRAWVEVQKSGKQASGTPRPMSGDIADSVYKRYADSFKQPIPAEFKRQSTGDSGNASGK